MGMGFRQALQFTVADREAEIARMAKQRGIMRSIVDSNARLMRAGYNKLIEEWKNKQGALKEKLKFVIAALTDKDKQFVMMAYNQMKQRMLMLNGVGMGDAEMKKAQLIKRLTNKGHNFQVMAVNCLREFLTSERIREEREREEFERQQKEKDRILRRIMDVNARFMGMGFRQALQHTVAVREAEIALMAKQRGIMRSIVDSNARLMRAGYNKLIEEWKARSNAMKEKLKFIIASLTDSDKQFSLMAYNGLKQRALMLSGVGMGNAGMKKISLIKRLTNQGHNFQVMAVNSLKEFLKDCR
jgi:L-asparaginase/Glu-tRNA(Gln) amidotransferase subunit D